MMKKLFVTLVCVLTFIIPPGTKANDMNIDKLIINKMKSIGIDIQNIEFDEIDPIELSSYDDFSKKDFTAQKEVSTYWSTLWHDNLDKLDIITKSSSTLKGYPVTNLIDKRIETAWVPGFKGVKGSGIGEWVSIKVYPQKPNCPSGFEYFSMVPGYLKSDQTWEENNRIKSSILIIERPDYPEGYAILRLNFKDYMGIQVFDIGQYSGGVYFYQRVWIIIEDVYKGTKYDDTCISEIVINGIYSQTAFDGPLE